MVIGEDAAAGVVLRQAWCCGRRGAAVGDERRTARCSFRRGQRKETVEGRWEHGPQQRVQASEKEELREEELSRCARG